jgi:hypothetical protein
MATGLALGILFGGMCQAVSNKAGPLESKLAVMGPLIVGTGLTYIGAVVGAVVGYVFGEQSEPSNKDVPNTPPI